MIFRKPYAFFIKNFKKFHFLLIILCGFIYSRTLQVISFNKDFLNYLSYDPYLEPISKYLNLTLYILICITIIIFIILIIILKRKDKPWKLYLIPIFDYVLLMIVFIYTSNFYNSYTGNFSTTTIRALNNFISICNFIEYPIFLILIVRLLGLDLKNFNFSADQEFLELDQDDRDEFEVSIDFDKHSLKRNIKKIKRNISYFYQENKFVCILVAILIIFFISFRLFYYFEVSHKTIKEKKAFNVNGYTMTINNSFYTDKDKQGNIIEADSAFIILNISLLNNGSSREFNGNDFHIVNGSNSYTFQGNTYSNAFSDLGNSFPIGKIKNNDRKKFALIFKVNKKLDYKKFILYYQEYMGNTSFLRKIKLDLNDVSKLENPIEIKKGDTIKLDDNNGNTGEFSIEDHTILDTINYNIEKCNHNNNCSIVDQSITIPNKKILNISFNSFDYEGEELINITKNYGSIIYTSNDGIKRKLQIEDALENKDYLGKHIYIKLPADIENYKNIDLFYTIRNKRYKYKIK